MFNDIVGSVVILVSGGVFKQATLAKRLGSDRVYARAAGGYIRLGPDTVTSHPKISYESLDCEFVIPGTPCNPPTWKI